MKKIYSQNSAPLSSNEISFSIMSIQDSEDLKKVNVTTDNSFSRLLLFRKCNGVVNIDLKEYDAGSNNVFFIRANQILRLDQCCEAEGFLLTFSKSYLGIDDESSDSDCLGKLLRFFSGQYISLQEDTMTDMAETLNKMLIEQNKQNLYKAELLKRYFRILLIYIMRETQDDLEDNTITRNTMLVERFMNLLEKGYVEKKMVSDYAAELFVSANYLNQIVKKITGNSAGFHIRERIVLEAKRKAVYSDRSMKEIGYLLGFEDPSHFSKLFKKTTGMNFIVFRREMIGTSFVPELGH